MALQLNTQKSTSALKLSMAKKNIAIPAMDVKFVLDVSGSFHDEHEEGLTNDFLTRVIPWALVFDPDKQMEVYTFSDGASSANLVGSVNESNYPNYVQREIIRNVPGYGHGTDYSFVLQVIAEKKQASSSLIGKVSSWFGKKAEPVIQKRSIVFFVTDGENSDHQATRSILSQMNDQFIIFVGMNNDRNASFPHLEQYAGKENVSYVRVTDINSFNNLSDEDLYDKFLSDKLLNWINKG
jgi:hypothetical protein